MSLTPTYHESFFEMSSSVNKQSCANIGFNRLEFASMLKTL